MRRSRAALEEADSFVRRMPTEIVGVLFLHDGRPIQPDPGRLDAYVAHPGARRGHWPSSAEIDGAMLEHFGDGGRDER